jgi:hypothetical protein
MRAPANIAARFAATPVASASFSSSASVSSVSGLGEVEQQVVETTAEMSPSAAKSWPGRRGVRAMRGERGPCLLGGARVGHARGSVCRGGSIRFPS